MRAGAYETHLQNAHTNLDIILASTIRNALTNRFDDPGTDKIDYYETSEPPDSYHESDPASDLA